MQFTYEASGQALQTKRKAIIDYHRNANYLVFTRRTAAQNSGFEETVAMERNFDKVMGNSRLLQLSSNFDKTNGLPLREQGLSKRE